MILARWMENPLIVIAVLMLLLTACGKSRPSRARVEAEIRECLIDVSVLPHGWTVAEGPGPYDLPERVLPGRALGGVAVSFFQPKFGARAFHRLFLYSSPRKSSQEFERQQQAEFFSSGRLTPWVNPRISYTGSIADRLRMACADFEAVHDTRRHYCTAMAQYGALLSIFDTWSSPEYMSEEEFAHVLQAIDERMKWCLDEKVPQFIPDE